MRTIQEFEERAHKEFAARQIIAFVHSYASTDRRHGHSIEKGAEP